ncbi:calcitonin gene-related peptide type 1 receptor-like [Ornithodoros turicata]|uniref:calcitonin gene-related peptide type 1 receptor-like n=1 Tax=Ornithodoros turicata TaxID=34597 RepID=UPI003139409A
MHRPLRCPLFSVLSLVLVTPLTRATDDSRTDAEVSYPTTCRIETGEELDPVTFDHVTCARCYSYIPLFAFRNETRMSVCGEYLCESCEPRQGCYKPQDDDVSQAIGDTFAKPSYIDKWKSCCREASRCCKGMLSTPLRKNPGSSLCPRTWDGWTCFEDTEGGTAIEKLCPAHAYYHTIEQPCQRFSKKLCWDNGTWYVHPGFEKEYTIYECGSVHNRQLIVGLSIILHFVSALLLLPAIIIFSFYAQLKIQRILMHKNLCISLLLYGITSIAVDYVLIWNEFQGPDHFETLSENPVWCKILVIFWRYFRLAQYHWMFCEAFYLNRLITTAFAEPKSVLLYHGIGWGIPVIILATYAVFRAMYGDAKCWIEPMDNYEWIILFPGLLCLVMNFAFLCNIIRILVTKLRTGNMNEPLQFRKAVRAVIILFPLFGTQFLLGVYRKPQLCGAWEVYQYFNRTTDALQGCFVALLFCYFSGEIQTHVLRSIDRMKLRYKMSRENNSFRRSTRTSIRLYAFGNSAEANADTRVEPVKEVPSGFAPCSL